MPPTKKRKAARKSKPRALRTDFVQAFTRTFVQGSGTPWPAQKQDPLSVAADLETFAAVLFQGATTCLQPLVVAHVSRGLVSTAAVQAFVNDYRHPGKPMEPEGWPSGEAGKKKADALGITFRTYRTAEVVAIMRILLQAVASFRKLGTGGAGGESTKIPPTVDGG